MDTLSSVTIPRRPGVRGDLRSLAFIGALIASLTPIARVEGETTGTAGPSPAHVLLFSKSSPASRLIIDQNQGAWSFEVGTRRVISDAKVEVVVPRPLAMPSDARFIKFRLFQHAGDWNAYIGYLDFRTGRQAAPSHVDSFTNQTPRDKYVSAKNLMWRTGVEGGLICPDARDVWAEIVYEATMTEIYWVYQVVQSDDVIEVLTSADGQSWTLLARRSGEGGITPRFQDADAVPLADNEVIPLGPAQPAPASGSDKLGPAQQVALQRTLNSGLRFSARWSLLESEPAVAMELSLSNTGHQALEVLGLHPATGFQIDPGAPAERCTVITSDYWLGCRPIVRLDQQPKTTEWWGTAVADRATQRAVVMGIAEAANAGITYQVSRRGNDIFGDLNANLSPGRAGKPLHIPAGSTFTLCRLLFLDADQVHAGLERYAELLAKNADVKQRLRPYSGLFTGYSSSPDLTTVITLNEQRVTRLLALLKEKLGRYGIDFIKIEFEPCGSPNLLDPKQYKMESCFPKGPRALSDSIRSMGFRPAIQSRTFTFVRGGDPKEREKTAEIYRRFTREWGFEYLMLDFNDTDIQNDDPTRPLIQVFRDRFRMIREAVGPDVFIEACMIPYGPVVGIADGFRPSPDFRGGSEDGLLPGFANRYYLHGRIFQLDTEFHDVAQRPFLWERRSVITPITGMQAWVSLCALTGYSYLFGGAIEETSDERFRIASRALPISGVAARPIDVAENPLPGVWSLCVSSQAPLRQTLGLFNWDYEATRTVKADLARCGLAPGKRYAAFDFWQQKFLGEVRDHFEASLTARNGQVIWLTEITDRPEIIGGSRQVTGLFNGRITGWDPGSLTLKGTVRGFGDDRVSLFIYVPRRLGVLSCMGGTHEQVEQQVVRVDVPTGRQESAWTLVFDPQSTVH